MSALVRGYYQLMKSDELQDFEPSYFMEQYVFTVDPNFKIWESKVFALKKGLWKFVVIPHETTLGIYLECVPPDHGVVRYWTCMLSGILRLKNHRRRSYKQAPFFNFNYSTVENIKKIGYDKFIDLQELYDPDNGWLYNDMITLEVSLIVDFDKNNLYENGYMGLVNQSSTCYMNTILQILFFSNILRFAVYQIPTEFTNDMMAFCLQRIFFEMQFNPRSVDIKDFTYLCGGVSPFSQEDATETLRNLLNKLEASMSKTSNNGLISGLFRGNLISYVMCLDIEYVNVFNVPFYDIQLNIHGRKDIYESFDAYINCDVLSGDNSYDAGVYGLQSALKGHIFSIFPPILHLHLMRFDYNQFSETPLKYKGRFEFPAVINLDKYLLKEISEDFGDYMLHAVLVHSGKIDSGHYVVFIDPKLDGHWVKFDDNVVTECSEKEAIEDNFGGFHTNSSAYMLVYIQRSLIDPILMDVPKNQIELNLATRIKLEQGFDDLNLKLELQKYIGDSFKYNEKMPPVTNQLNVDEDNISKIIATKADVNFTKTISTISRLVYDNKKINVNDGGGDMLLPNTFKFNLFWMASDFEMKKNLTVEMAMNDTVNVLLQMAVNCIKLTMNIKTKMRLLKIVNHEIVEICKEDALIISLIYHKRSLTNSVDTEIVLPTYRIEEVPTDQNLSTFELLLPVFHFKQNISNTFGVPFLIKVRSCELYFDIKRRIQKRLDMTDAEWKTLKLYIIVDEKCSIASDKGKIPNSIFGIAFEGKFLPRFGLDHSSKDAVNQD